MIITAIIIIVIIVAGIVGYLAYQNYMETKTTGTEWGDLYYSYLKESTKKDNNKNDYGLEDNMENTKIQFIQIDEEEPAMAITYNIEESEYVNVYKTNDKNQVEEIISKEQGTVEFLYNIEKESYNWYIHTEDEKADIYNKIETQENKTDSITINKDDVTTQTTVSGETITLEKYDETFIKPDVEIKEIEFKENIEAKDLRQEIEDLVTEYKTNEEIITDEIKTETENEVQELETTKQKIETAKEEVKAEEERKAEEEKQEKEKAEKQAYVGTYTNEAGNSGTISLNSNNDLIFTYYNNTYKIDLSQKQSSGAIKIYEADNDEANYQIFLYPIGISYSVFKDGGPTKVSTDSTKNRIVILGSDVPDVKYAVYYKK